MNNRIYVDSVDINPDDVRSFYDKRAENSVGNNSYSSVLLNDGSPELVEEQMRIEEQFLLPRLRFDNTCKVLDVGCGIGRWAEKAVPACGYYYGIDFSENMIKTAKTRVPSGEFECISFQELVKSNPKTKFNRVIISQILMYISDDKIRSNLEGLLDFLDVRCIIYIWESCGIGRRLTLNKFHSESLNSEYSVIYRTKSEYDELLRVFTDSGFSVGFNKYHSELGGTTPYNDSDKIYYILERGVEV